MSPLTAADHIVRARNVGASEASALLGLHPHKSVMDVFLRLTTGQEQLSNLQMEIGEVLEPAVVHLYAKRQKLFNLDIEPSKTLTSPSWPHLAASPDRLVTAHGETKLLEVKTHAYFNADADWGEEGTAEVPEHHKVQVQMTLAVTGLKKADLAVLFSGRDFRIYCLEADPLYQKAIHDVVTDFWTRNIEKNVPPDPDGHERYTEYLKRKYPQAKDSVVFVATEEQEAWMAKYDEARAAVKHWGQVKDLAWQNLANAIGVGTGLVGKWGKATWSNIKGKPEVDWEMVARELNASEALIQRHTMERLGHRQLRVTAAKKRAEAESGDQPWEQA